MNINLTDKNEFEIAFEFVDFPPFLAGSEAEQLFSVCRRKLTVEKTILFINLAAPFGTEVVEQLKGLCRTASSSGSACFLLDNPWWPRK